jgi:subtilisin-like proprotein convertase family protein
MRWLNFAVALVVAAPAGAAEQTLELSAGWNLVSFHVSPADPTVETVLAPLRGPAGAFEILWTYDAAEAGGMWRVFADRPGQPPAAAQIAEIETGRGYWLRVSRPAELTVVGDALPQGAPDLVPGWNLIGFTSPEALPYARIFGARTFVQEIWTYVAVPPEFKGVVLPPSGTPERENFTDLEPGKAYWVLAGQPVSLTPLLRTMMSGDIDAPPLLPDAPFGQPKIWTAKDPDDLDVGEDGVYDGPETQRAIGFGGLSDAQSIGILNDGNGILNWRATILDGNDGDWLQLQGGDQDESGAQVSGTVAIETDRVELVVNRAGMKAGGPNRATVRITTNAPPPDDVRDVQVTMFVPTLDGDYRVIAHVDSIDGKPADTADPKLFLSLYHDRDGLKAIIDEQRTLLVPSRVRMVGGVYVNDGNRFAVGGSFEVPPGPDNPYQVPVRRDITLLGDRPRRGDTTVNPLDLKGQYVEVVRGLLPEPIQLIGTFIATRVAVEPSVTDALEIDSSEADAGTIPDGQQCLDDACNEIPGRDCLMVPLEADRRIITTAVDVAVQLAHERPRDLRVTLIAPDGACARLRDRSATVIDEDAVYTYDDDTAPKEPLDRFNGGMAIGTWVLVLEDLEPGVVGRFKAATLRLTGTEVHDIKGTVPAQAPAGSIVLLSGCGLSLIATPEPDGSYEFRDLVDCAYHITLHSPGYRSSGDDVVLAGADRLDQQLALGSLLPPETHPHEYGLPDSDPGCGSNCFVFTWLTTAGGAGVVGALENGIDAATFDLDREPCTTPARRVGPEDVDRFTEAENTLAHTHTNQYFAPGNGRIDPPIGSNSHRLLQAIRVPIIGESVSPAGRLLAGALLENVDQWHCGSGQ